MIIQGDDGCPIPVTYGAPLMPFVPDQAEGRYKDEEDFSAEVALGPCSSEPGDLDGFSSSESGDDAGVNGAEDGGATDSNDSNIFGICLLYTSDAADE